MGTRVASVDTSNFFLRASANLSVVLFCEDLAKSERIGVPPGERSMPSTRLSLKLRGALLGEGAVARPSVEEGGRCVRRSCTFVMSARDTLRALAVCLVERSAIGGEFSFADARPASCTSVEGEAGEHSPESAVPDSRDGLSFTRRRSCMLTTEVGAAEETVLGVVWNGGPRSGGCVRWWSATVPPPPQHATQEDVVHLLGSAGGLAARQRRNGRRRRRWGQGWSRHSWDSWWSFIFVPLLLAPCLSSCGTHRENNPERVSE